MASFIPVSFSNQYNAVSRIMPQQSGILYQGQSNYSPSLTPASPGSSNLSPTAFSQSLNPFGSIGIPNLIYAPRGFGAAFAKANQDYVYSVPAGGYVTAADALNANSWVNKFGAGSGGDYNANNVMRGFYNELGSLPTMPIGTPALNQLYASGAATPPPPGPSYNQSLQNFFSGNASAPLVTGLARSAGFGLDYRGPYSFGQPDAGYRGWRGY